MQVDSSFSDSTGFTGPRRTARLIDIRLAIDRSQPPKQSGFSSCPIFRIAWMKTSWQTSCASASLPNRRIAVAKTARSYRWNNASNA
jgi:hypothetical protein